MTKSKLKHIKEFKEENNNDLFEMANILPKHTGLPMIIWISPRMSNHGPRIKVQNSYSQRVTPDKLFVITIEDSPKIIGDVGQLSKKDIDLAVQFVKNNLNILLDYWYERDIDIMNIISGFKKINEVKKD